MSEKADFQDTSASFDQTLLDAADGLGNGTVTLRQIMVLIGEQGLLLLCALLTIPFLLPVSIPGVSTVFGLAIILIGFGVLMNRHPWLPRQIMDRPLDAEKLATSLRKGAGLAARIGRVIRPRLHGMTGGAAINRFNALAIIWAAVLLMLPLGLVPFSNTLPAFAILFLCIGMTQRDGLFVIAGYAMVIATMAYFSALAWGAYVAGKGIASLAS